MKQHANEIGSFKVLENNTKLDALREQLQAEQDAKYAERRERWADDKVCCHCRHFRPLYFEHSLVYVECDLTGCMIDLTDYCDKFESSNNELEGDKQ